MASGFFDRQTRVRSADGTRLALWPKESPRGLHEHQTAELVYTPGARCCPAEVLGRDPLYRVSPAIPAFTVVLNPEYRRYSRTLAAIEEACGLASAAAGGRVVFRPPDVASGPSVEVTSGPDPLGRSLVAAFADRTFDANGYITGGRIVAVDPEFLAEGWRYVDTVQLFVHELGHMDQGKTPRAGTERRDRLARVSRTDDQG